MIFRSLLAAAALLFGVSSAHAALDSGDLICETSTTTGTGTLNLGGAIANYVTFVSQIASGNTVPYHIIASDGKLEAGTGTFVDASPDTLSRTADWSTDGSGAELTLPAGSHTVCVGPVTGQLVGADLSPQLGGDLDLLGQTIFDSTASSAVIGVNATAGFNIYDTAGDTHLQIIGDDDGAAGASVYLSHISASAADGDIPGAIYVLGGADLETVGQIRMELDDGATGTEDTQWQFVLRSAGSDLTALTLGTVDAFFGTPGHVFNLPSGGPGAIMAVNASAGAVGAYYSGYHNSASPADNDEVGGIDFSGEDDGGNATIWGGMYVTALDVTHTTEDSSIRFDLQAGGSTLTALTLGTNSLTEPLGLTYGNQMSFGSAGSPVFQLHTSAATATGALIEFYQDSATPAASDNVGGLLFAGEDSAGNAQMYSQILGGIADTTSTSEDGYIQFKVTSAGSDLTALTLGDTSLTFDGTYHHTFDMGTAGFGGIVVKNSATSNQGASLALYADSSSPTAGDDIGQIEIWGRDTAANIQNYGYAWMEIQDATSTSEDSAWKFQVQSAGSALTAMTLGGTPSDGVISYGHIFDTGTVDGARLEIKNSTDGTSGARLSFYHNSPGPADNDSIGAMLFYGEDDGAAATLYAFINAIAADVTNATEDGRLDFSVLSGGAALTALTLGTTDPVFAQYTHSFDGGSVVNRLMLTSTADAGFGSYFTAYNNSASPAANDELGGLAMFGEDGAGNAQAYGDVIGIIADTTSTTEDGTILLRPLVAGTVTAVLAVSATATFGDAYDFFFQAGGSFGINDGNVIALYETEANGDNFQAFNPPDAITSDATCNFENDANFIPDACVGDGSDASDGRLKDVIGQLANAGAVLDQIKIYDYKWNTDSDKSEAVRKGRHGVGPVAQELFKVNPDFVEIGGENPIDDPWTWKPEKLVPYLIAEIQNLRKRVQELEAR
jgi:hypothetical protein